MSTESPWNAPLKDVIDPLVSVLKSTRRWGRDGRSLRALNSHWCAAMNRHVVEVKPHHSRKLSIEDIDSLLKFPNLTTLYTVEFEQEGFTCSVAKCRKLLNTLGKLPRLSRLGISALFEFLEDRHISDLNGVTSLEGNFYDKLDLSKISTLALEEVSGVFSEEDFIQWIPKIPTLKTLHIYDVGFVENDNFADIVECIKGLETVSFHTEIDDLAEWLPQMTNLVSADIDNARLELFSDLPRLTSLYWEFKNVEDLSNKAFSQLMKRLKTLCLYYVGDEGNIHVQIPDDLFAGSTTLESLEFYACKLTPGLIEVLPRQHLTSFSIKHCEIPGRLTFVGTLTTLKEFKVQKNYYEYPTLEMNLTPLSGLRCLEIYMDHCLTSVELLREIHCLTNLESLTLSDVVHCDFDRFSLESLEAPGVLSTPYACVVMPRTAVEKFFNLKMLASLETLCIRICTLGATDKAFMDHQEKFLREKAPHLKLDVQII